MSSSFAEIWKQNRGNSLFGVALFTTALACVLWHFDLLPEIELQPSQAVGENIQPAEQRPASLVVLIVAPKSLPNKTINGYVEMHGPFGNIPDSGGNISTHLFQIHEGGTTSVEIKRLPPGEYAPVVFLDTNGNGALDIQATDSPPEAFRTAIASDATPSDLALEQNSILLESGSSKFVYIRF